MQYIYSEPTEYSLKDRDGHHGKFFGTSSPTTDHLIIECDEKLTVALIEHKVEYNYYVIQGEGYFIINDKKLPVEHGDLIVIPPGTKYSFGGKLKMLLISTPRWSEDQETIIRD